MCPVCTVTVVAGLSLSRLLGIDDVITSLWIGAFVLSFSFVTYNWMVKKWPKTSSFHLVPFTLLMYLLVLVPLKFSGTIGIIGNTLWGMDKILLGTFVGSITFLVGVWGDKKLRKINGGKQFVKFQKVVIPVVSLVITSIIFWLIVK